MLSMKSKAFFRPGKTGLPMLVAILAASACLSQVAYYWKVPVAVQSSCGGNASAIMDRDVSTTWHHWVNESHWIVLDMGESATIGKIRTWHERQWDDEHALSEIYVSENTTDWGASLGSMDSTYSKPVGWIEADIADKAGRYLKLVFAETNTPYWREVSVLVSGEPDVVSPAAVADLSATSVTSTSVTLNWTATGDDGVSGKAALVDIRYSEGGLTETSWATAVQAVGEPIPSPSGHGESFSVTLNASDAHLGFIAGARTDGIHAIPFRLYRPAGYDGGDGYPLVVYLHHAGTRGIDNTRQIGEVNLEDGLAPWMDLQNSHPAFILAPQCPADSMWVDSHWSRGSYDLDAVPESDEMNMVMMTIDYLLRTYRIHAGRVFVTGCSMGGLGTWDALLRHPDRFAAGMPVCGAGSPDHAATIRNVPVWAFHGRLDDTIPVQASRDMVHALTAAGGDVRFTEYPDYGHDVWQYAYADQQAIDWVYSIIDPPNHAPVVSPVSVPSSFNEVEFIAFPITVTDGDGDRLVLNASSLPSGATLSDQGNGSWRFSWQTDLWDAGNYHIIFSANDGEDDSNPVAIDFTVMDLGTPQGHDFYLETVTASNIAYAVSVIRANGGGTLYLPACDVSLGDPVLGFPAGVSVVGQGPGKTVLRDCVFRFIADEVGLVGGGEVRLSGISFVNDFDAPHPYFLFRRCNGFRLDHCRFEGQFQGTFLSVIIPSQEQANTPWSTTANSTSSPAMVFTAIPTIHGSRPPGTSWGRIPARPFSSRTAFSGAGTTTSWTPAPAPITYSGTTKCSTPRIRVRWKGTVPSSKAISSIRPTTAPMPSRSMIPESVPPPLSTGRRF
jgi:predicted esterase